MQYASVTVLCHAKLIIHILFTHSKLRPKMRIKKMWTPQKTWTELKQGHFAVQLKAASWMKPHTMLPVKLMTCSPVCFKEAPEVQS